MHRFRCECGQEERRRFELGKSVEEIPCKCGGIMRKVYKSKGNFTFEGNGYYRDYIKKEENECVGRQARRARHLKDTGQVPEDEVIKINDKRVKDK